MTFLCKTGVSNAFFRSVPRFRGRKQKRTPHLLLLLDIRVLHTQQDRLILQILLQAHKFGDIELQCSCIADKVRLILSIFLHWLNQSPEQIQRPLNSPRGPFTVIVLLTVGLYEVATLVVFRSPMDNSTPGGIEIGVRPSFEGRFVVVENCLCANVCHAGTRNPGNATGEDVRKAWPNAFPLVGTNFEAIGSRPCCRNGCWCVATKSSRPPG